MKKKYAYILILGLFILTACSFNQESDVPTNNNLEPERQESSENNNEGETIGSTDKFEFYTEVIEYLIDSEGALVYKTEYLSLDLSNNPLELDDEEIKELKYKLEQTYDKKVLFFSYEELVKEGMINEEELFWENGAIVKIEGKEKIKNNKLGFRCELWRSGKGAIFFEDCNATWNKNGGLDDIEYNGESIS